MKKLIPTAGLVGCLAFAMQTSHAGLHSAGSGLYWDGTNIHYVCKVTQTAGASDYATWPGGKATACTVNGTPLGYPWCTTNAAAGNWCQTAQIYGPGNQGSYAFSAVALGLREDWEPQDSRSNYVVCSSYGNCVGY